MKQVLSTMENSIWLRMLTALVAGLLLGFLGSQFRWSVSLFLLSSLLLGMIGALTVNVGNERPRRKGLCAGGFSWFGVWLSVLVQESLHPQMITITTSGCWASACDNCLVNASACGPTTETVPFSPLLVFIFVVIFLIGLFLVVVSALTTNSVLNFARQVHKNSL